MTPLETTRLSPEQIKSLSEDQIQELPTILEVLEYLSSLENTNMRNDLRESGFEDLYREGKFALMSDQAWTNIPKLYPCSQTTFTLMRGESDYHADSHPSLYRSQKNMSDEDFRLIARLRACEFISILKRHPVVQELESICKVEYMAIAQHYEFATEYMDITNQKWVAAFFACTEKKGERYIPIVPRDEKKIGVVYVGEPTNNQTYPDKVQTLGFHYFSRPTRQNALVYQMTENENFDADPFFKRIVFRHDTAASEFVYKMSYEQQRYFPWDRWTEIAESICRSDYPISQAAIDESRHYGVMLSDDEIREVLQRNHIPFTASNVPQAMPMPSLMQEEHYVWRTYLLPHLKRNTLQLLPIYQL